MENNPKINKLTVTLGAIILALLLSLGWVSHQNTTIGEQYKTEIVLRNALQAEMLTSKDEFGKVTAEKLSLQTDVKTLTSLKDKVSKEKQELIKLVEKQQKNLIAAATVKTIVKVEKLYVASPVASTDSSATFDYKSDTLNCVIDVNGVRVDSTKTPSLLVRKMEIPNTAEISFQWGEKKEGYPVSFKITNSNPLFKTENIESYAIPELKKQELKPGFLQNIKITLLKGKTPFAIGVGAGAIGVLLLTGAVR